VPRLENFVLNFFHSLKIKYKFSRSIKFVDLFSQNGEISANLVTLPQTNLKKESSTNLIQLCHTHLFSRHHFRTGSTKNDKFGGFHSKMGFNFSRCAKKNLRPILNYTPRGNLWPQGRSCPPGVNFVPWEWSYSLGVKLSVCP
jgi:hypothetical protein